MRSDLRSGSHYRLRAYVDEGRPHKRRGKNPRQEDGEANDQVQGKCGQWRSAGPLLRILREHLPRTVAIDGPLTEAEILRTQVRETCGPGVQGLLEVRNAARGGGDGLCCQLYFAVELALGSPHLEDKLREGVRICGGLRRRMVGQGLSILGPLPIVRVTWCAVHTDFIGWRRADLNTISDTLH